MNTILVPVDFTPVTHKQCAAALKLAQAFAATVYVLHVVLPNEDTSYRDKPQMGREFEAEGQQLNEIAALFRDRGLETHALLVEGVTVAVIKQEADRLDADLIVVARHNPQNLLEIMPGSVSAELARQSASALMIVPA